MTSELSVFAARLRELIPLWLEAADAASAPLSPHSRQKNAIYAPEPNWIGRAGTPPPVLQCGIDGAHGVTRPTLRFVSGFNDAEFNGYALLLFALQYGHNEPYRKLCAARGVTPDSLSHWTQIPAMPTSAFKEYDVTCLSPEERTAVFHSSGTTEQRPSRHFHSAESLEIYETSLWAWFVRHLAGDLRFTIYDLQLAVLTPTPAHAPHSSLVHMFEVVRRQAGAPETVFHGDIGPDGAWNLDGPSVVKALRAEDKRPVVLLGTAFSFVHLLDYLAENNLWLELPAGSRVMETGGYKGRSRTMPRAELHRLIAHRLGVPESHIICEYGMSELSSQAYDSEVGQPPSGSHRGNEVENRLLTSAATVETQVVPCSFHFPPWARVHVVSPETGLEVEEGGIGIIRIFDLANVFSVMAVQTEDLAVRRGNGFELIGRAGQAEPRGCSLMSVEI